MLFLACAQTGGAQAAGAGQDAAHASAASSNLVRFEVATIKPDGARFMQTQVYPDRVVIDDYPLTALIEIAFNLSYWQISGGEDWTKKDAYDIEAKPPESALKSIVTLQHTLFDIKDDHLREMLQALLIDRFGLKYHFETRTGDVFLLERSGKPLRLAPTKVAGANTEQSRDSWGSIGWAEGWVLINVTMPQLAHFAGNFYLHRPVLDRTGLSGAYDYRSPHEDPDSQGAEPPDSFLNMIHDIGFKLEAAKGPVQLFVIDHAEKPSPN